MQNCCHCHRVMDSGIGLDQLAGFRPQARFAGRNLIQCTKGRGEACGCCLSAHTPCEEARTQSHILSCYDSLSLDSSSIAGRFANMSHRRRDHHASHFGRDSLSASRAPARFVKQPRNLSSLSTSSRCGLAKWLTVSRCSGHCTAVIRPRIAGRERFRGGGKASELCTEHLLPWPYVPTMYQPTPPVAL